jgi:N-acetyl-gamma-glutamyl-phosphate reductase
MTSPARKPTKLTKPAADCASAGCCDPGGPAVARVAVVGGAGYTGALLAELLLKHPCVQVTHISSERLAGDAVRGHLPRLRTDLEFCTAADVVAAGSAAVDIAFVCSPHGEAAPVVMKLLTAGLRVIDLSADFRLPADQYGDWYGPHPHPDLTPGVYGLTEFHRAEVAGARLVANPGCYPTTALLALTPLLKLGLLDVIIDAKSGVSGAGATPSERTHFCSVDSDLIAYGLQGHRHFPEIANGVGADISAGICAGAGKGPGATRKGPALTFVPHLVPLQRGIVETIYVRAEKMPVLAGLRKLYSQAYAGEPFVQISDDPPELKDVAGTNVCRIFVTIDERAGRIIVIAALDNLMKGAAGQALQNMNVMLGCAETEGLN